MPRIRTIKPDAFLSESLSSVDRGTRWTFAGLWTYADDKGRARDDARLVKAALYPLDDRVSLEDVTQDLHKLAEIGAICRYVVDGRSYLHMPKWGEHQRINRPTPVKSPPCPFHEGGGSGHLLVTADSVSPHGALTEPSTWEGKGKEGKGREGSREREGKGNVPDRSATDADSPTSLALVQERPDVTRLCNHLADRIAEDGSKRPPTGKGWHDAARLILDRDGHTEQEVHAAIDWCQTHHFWRTNVLSMPKLREKFDQLRKVAESDQQRTTGSRNAESKALLDRAMERAEARERQMGIR